jgi:aspartate carbamoyltransferase catalytic subunit
VINAGDGGHFHPTQTLADLLTIHREMGRLNNLTIGLCGDLKYGRTVHSLIAAMSRYEGIRFVLISPEELKTPSYVIYNELQPHNIPYTEVTSLEEALPELDVLYMTRIQRERFDDPQQYERLKDSYVLNVEKMQLAKRNMCVLHPLPRVNEISVAVDDDPRAAYFRQALNGKYMRMALILKLLEDAKNGVEIEENTELIVDEFHCTNPRCITSTEQELQHTFRLMDATHGIYRCIYCDSKATR